MRVERVERAEDLRALVPGAESVAERVAEIVAEVRLHGDAALARYAAELDGVEGPLVVDPAQCAESLERLDAELRDSLELAFANVSAVAAAWQRTDTELELAQGQRIALTEKPVGHAAIYAPGGRNPYPSTVVMGVAAARAAGVETVTVCAPRAHPLMLAAAALCGADAVVRSGGAHTVAALAYGTETIARADVIAGPGGLYVQEAKRQVCADAGIDMFAGPSDLMVVAQGGVDDDAVVADLLAQAEHGAGSLAVLVSDDEELLAHARRAGERFASDAVLALLAGADPLDAIDTFAPEHLQLVGPGPERLAGSVANAGCVFVGASTATAFGDYVAGSNHTLPTLGAARFASGLNPGHFLRRVTTVRIDAAAAARLAGPGAALARAEGFAQHATSIGLRENGER